MVKLSDWGDPAEAGWWSIFHTLFQFKLIKTLTEVDIRTYYCFLQDILLFIAIIASSLANSLKTQKSKQGGLKIWNLQGYQRSGMWNFQGLIKSKVGFPRVTKKKPMKMANVEFSGVFVFGLGGDEVSKGSSLGLGNWREPNNRLWPSWCRWFLFGLPI